jgi:uncharacterized membrane protein
MSSFYAFALCLHVLAAALWVGGMAVMHTAVRPAAAQTLDAPLRLAFLAAALGRFFRWVTAAIVVLLATGMSMIALAGGFGRVHWSVHAMLAIGLVMMALFGHLRANSYPRLQRTVGARDWPQAALHLQAIRKLVFFNLVLGCVVFVVAIVGRAF